MSEQTKQLALYSEPQIEGAVADQLLIHLEAETATLAAMLNAVKNVHQALKHFDDEALQQSLEDEARQLASSISLQSQRAHLQDEFAILLQIPAKEITVRRLIPMTSGAVRNSIENVWRSLSEMAAEVEQLNQMNAALIGQSLSIARGVVERLSGVAAVGESYNAGGVRAECHVGPLIQWGA